MTSLKTNCVELVRLLVQTLKCSTLRKVGLDCQPERLPMAHKKKEPIPEPRTITLPPRTYQPSKAEHEAEHDMPDASMETARRAFFRPFEVKAEEC